MVTAANEIIKPRNRERLVLETKFEAFRLGLQRLDSFRSIFARNSSILVGVTKVTSAMLSC